MHFIVLGTTIYAFIPGLAILLLNCTTVLTLLHKAHQRRLMTSQQQHSHHQSMTNRTTAMLLGVSFTFILLVVPIGLSHIISVFTNNYIYETTNPAIVGMRETTQAAEMLNYSINFLLYIICNKAFRARFMKIMSCCRKPHQVHPMSITVKTQTTSM